MALSLKRFISISLEHPKSIIRNIMTTTSKSEKALENLQKNPYFGKYAERIATLQKTSPEEFLRKVEEREKNKSAEKKNKFASVDTRQFSSALNPKEALTTDTTAQEKNLNDIFKIELVKDKNAVEVQAIWEEYHKMKEVISATIPKDVYSNVQQNMKQHPTFLFPLPRSEGYEYVMCQNYEHAVHFTPLLAYQVHQENAPECLTMVHYTELSEKGIVLMRGEYDKNVLTGKEAQCLANQFQLYYNGKDENKLNLLEKFTKTPDSFKHIDLITELENIKLV